MGQLRMITAAVFAGCLVLGVSLSFLAGGGSETTSGTNVSTGDSIGSLHPMSFENDWAMEVVNHFAFGANFHAASSDFTGSAAIVTDIYDGGEHVASFSSGRPIYDEEFPLDTPLSILSVLPYSGAKEEEDDSERWVQVVGRDGTRVTSWTETDTGFRFGTSGYSWAHLEERAVVEDGERTPFGAIAATGRSIEFDQGMDRFEGDSRNGVVIVFSVYVTTDEDAELDWWDDREE
ncbi:hypothetical protein CR205_12855 [Alteribacter lacisalsi]|uniref:Uncharacterized protein n=1 Tax=Alteribacter lacisalsi TaxID=2045244 RepID=A0A2W0H432_9BACI|nr:hypothetical protein [Alteribacter lacisalsi]PYZ96594.1 hypothetical protein CR205_12855 [Alteribacter lacisalsi]